MKIPRTRNSQKRGIQAFNKAKRNLRLEGNEGIDGLASELICGTDDSSLGNTLMKDESRFDLSG